MNKRDCQHPDIYPNCKACPTNQKIDPVEFERKPVTIATEGYIIKFDNLNKFADAIISLMYGGENGQ